MRNFEDTATVSLANYKPDFYFAAGYRNMSVDALKCVQHLSLLFNSTNAPHQPWFERFLPKMSSLKEVTLSLDGAPDSLASSDGFNAIQKKDFKFVLEQLASHSKPLRIHTFLRLYFSESYDLDSHLEMFTTVWSKWKELNIETLLVETGDSEYRLGNKLVQVFDSVPSIRKFGFRSVNLHRYEIQDYDSDDDSEQGSDLDFDMDPDDGSLTFGRRGDRSGLELVIAKLSNLEELEINGIFPDAERDYYVKWPAGSALRSLAVTPGYVSCSTKFEDFDSLRQYDHELSDNFTELPTFRNLDTLTLRKSDLYRSNPAGPKLEKCLEHFTTFNTKLVNLIVHDCKQEIQDKLLRRYLARIQRLEVYSSRGWKFESIVTQAPRLRHLVYETSYSSQEDGIPLAYLINALLGGKVGKDLKTIQFKAKIDTHRPQADFSLKPLMWAAAQLPDHWPLEAIQSFVGRVVNKPKNMTFILDVPALLKCARIYATL